MLNDDACYCSAAPSLRKNPCLESDIDTLHLQRDFVQSCCCVGMLSSVDSDILGPRQTPVATPKALPLSLELGRKAPCHPAFDSITFLKRRKCCSAIPLDFIPRVNSFCHISSYHVDMLGIPKEHPLSHKNVRTRKYASLTTYRQDREDVANARRLKAFVVPVKWQYGRLESKERGE